LRGVDTNARGASTITDVLRSTASLGCTAPAALALSIASSQAVVRRQQSSKRSGYETLTATLARGEERACVLGCQ